MLYFAYGSNMCSKRLKKRVPSMVTVTIAALPGHQLAFNKVGSDGSAKCNLASSEDFITYGVIFQIDDIQKSTLDRIEGKGYKNVRIDVETHAGVFDVFTYRAKESYIDDTLSPYNWYKSLVVAGAKEHDLPAHYIKSIQEINSIPDTETKRAQAHLQLL
ncbi:gamma-glutamylcyclotransferase family protein [Fodinibius halophilus]|uniref:Gamma-glutamylcyclotransferase n=1 Tax=Fodinibius halophilus TaxID=1736908 RepID=A0A6M1TIN4_9BACT|nr:gamma-glutamylcyclotransferase family protein [Fodinibius halophilus]NGP89912.1 gamma-glutamylcyclotransferase [Fodinibius halophilus]